MPDSASASDCCQNEVCETSWSGRSGRCAVWPSTRLRPHNDGMTGSVAATEAAPRAEAARPDAGRAAPGRADPGAPPLLTVSGLTASYGPLRALEDVHL